YNQVFFGNTTLQNINPGANTTDWFIAKYENTNCNCNLLQPDFNIANLSGNTYNFTYSGGLPYTSISWDFGDGSPPVTSLNASHTYTTNGSYPVCVTVTNGCGTNKMCKWVHITTATNIEDVNHEDGISIYPNPATNNITIENILRNSTLEICNLQGQKVYHTIVEQEQTLLDIKSLHTGIYFIRITNKNGEQTYHKLIKQ